MRAEQGPLRGCDPGGGDDRVASSAAIFLMCLSDAPLQRKGGQDRDFFHGFLHVVLAKCPLAGRMRFRDALRRDRLAYRQQQNIAGRALRSLRRARNPCANCLQVDGD